MTEFKAWFEPFIWGLMVGYFWHPAWIAIKKIVSEVKKAKEEW
jgi:hypothetical protein